MIDMLIDNIENKLQEMSYYIYNTLNEGTVLYELSWFKYSMILLALNILYVVKESPVYILCVIIIVYLIGVFIVSI